MAELGWNSATRAMLAGAAVAALLALQAGTVTVQAADHTPPPVHKAIEYPCSETHIDEHVTIAVDPYDSADKTKFFRFDALKAGFLPVRFIVDNDSDKSLDLSQARILFITAGGQKINAAQLEDLQRAGGQLKMHPPGSVTPLPFPFPNKPKDKGEKQIEDDYNMLSYTTTLIAPHSSASGFLWYDVSGLETPVLQGAQMYVRLIRTADGKDLFNFTIPFDKYLRMQ